MATFNPPYNMHIDFQGSMDLEPVITFQDASGKDVLKSEVDEYALSLETTPTI